jgi:hypothetical protein
MFWLTPDQPPMFAAMWMRVLSGEEMNALAKFPGDTPEEFAIGNALLEEAVEVETSFREMRMRNREDER